MGFSTTITTGRGAIRRDGMRRALRVRASQVSADADGATLLHGLGSDLPCVTGNGRRESDVVADLHSSNHLGRGRVRHRQRGPTGLGYRLVVERDPASLSMAVTAPMLFTAFACAASPSPMAARPAASAAASGACPVDALSPQPLQSSKYPGGIKIPAFA